MKSIRKKALLFAALGAAASLTTLEARAGATIPFGDDKSVSVGFGMRTSYSNIENGAPDGSRSNDFNLDSARLYLAEPGYYGTGTYLGSKDIFAIGVAGRQQKDGVLTVAGVGDYRAWTIDFLLEKRLGGGAVSLEAAYYNLDEDARRLLALDGNLVTFRPGSAAGAARGCG